MIARKHFSCDLCPSMSTGAGDLNDWEQDYWADLQCNDPADLNMKDLAREKRDAERDDAIRQERWERTRIIKEHRKNERYEAWLLKQF